MAQSERERSADAGEGDEYEMAVQGIEQDPLTPDGFLPVRIRTTRGVVECRYYPTAAAGPVVPTGPAALFVGGVGGGFDTPVKGFLYPRLCQEMSGEDQIPCLRVRYRHPADLAECTLDVLAGIAFLESDGAGAVALVGHSFGGAVVIQAAAHSERVRTVLPLSTQSAGTEPAAELGPRCSMFLAHGTADEILPAACSQQVYRIAREPKHIELCPGSNHGLDQCAEYLPGRIRRWIREELSRLE